jgi:uroporphyrinogen-III synthase
MHTVPVAAPSRVIVTRPAREAARWVRDLAGHGIAAVALPLIAIGPCTTPEAIAALQAARDRAPSYRALMFVSGNAVAFFFGSKHPVALVAVGDTAIKTRAWAPGPGTAHALAQAGVPQALIDGPAHDAPQFDSEALWKQVGGQLAPGDRVLIVRGQSGGTAEAPEGTGRDWLARQIESAGASVDFVAAYQRLPAVWNASDIALARQAAHDGSVWLFSSSEAVTHLAAALPGQDWAHARALATHPRIAEAARAVGFGHVGGCRPSLEDVVASIESAA